MPTEFDRFVESVRVGFPGLQVTPERPPVHADGAWWLDVQIPETTYRIIFEYFEKHGFGLHVSGKDEGYGERPLEWLKGDATALQRVRALVAAAADNPEDLYSYERMLTSLTNAEATTPQDLYEGTLTRFLRDARYHPLDIVKADHQARLARGWA